MQIDGNGASSSIGGPPDSREAQPLPEVRLHSLLGEGFHVRRTDQFILFCNTPDADVNDLVEHLQATYAAVVHYCSDFGLEPVTPSAQMRVVFFNRPEALEKFREVAGIKQTGGVGSYDADSGLALFYNLRNHPDANQATDTEIERFNRLVVQHEIAHQVLFHWGVHVRGEDNPAWLVEGLACLFEGPTDSSAKKAPVLNLLRLADFRAAIGAESDEQSVAQVRWARALELGRVVTLEAMIGDDGVLDPARPHAPYRYAQAWALVHYLGQVHPKAWAEYVKLASRRINGDEAPRERRLRDFRSCFGPPDDAFLRRWLDYILRQPFVNAGDGP